MPVALHELGELQLAVLNTLWQLKSATVHESRDLFPDPKPAYTTVLTVLRKLEKHGLVGHEAIEGSRQHRYRPLISAQDVRDEILRDVLARLFAGSPAFLIKYILQTEGLSSDELKDLRAAIDVQEKAIARNSRK